MTDTYTLKLNDGRTLAYACYGRVEGKPLYFMHGFPGSRYQAALIHEQAKSAGIFVVAPERPGFGKTSLMPKRKITDWPNDMCQLADKLGHVRFGVLGTSCGGPYALACAHSIPSRLNFVGVVSGMAPRQDAAIRKGELPMLKALFALARIHPWLIAPLMLIDRVMFMRDAQKAVKVLAGMLSEPDRQFLASNTMVLTRLGVSLKEAYAPGICGVMQDAALIARNHGYALEGIRIPVYCPS
ncbi:alpha/beta fold hydrolase [Nitrosomonas sp. sh817]|uniref:alpha/beta fold hydrolase n=1 Tax=Nitrosomonas sp. sh817 TaxID=3070658 RepID=UPI0027DB1096|nr:alpha/beta hydrolase [Nitrosomonas sp. sh817]WMJ08190.1 alpha/beta hydrolase [Nitrosomonas sp. sh817]